MSPITSDKLNRDNVISENIALEKSQKKPSHHPKVADSDPAPQPSVRSILPIRQAHSIRAIQVC